MDRFFGPYLTIFPIIIGFSALAAILAISFWLNARTETLFDDVVALRAVRTQAVVLRNALQTAESSQPHEAPVLAGAGQIQLAVVGAHLSGLPLNHELVSLGAVFLREVQTTASYKLFALPNTKPAKPGLLRVAAPEGASIVCEIWALDAAAFGAFVARIPSPLGIGTISFADGTTAKGFLVEAIAVQGAQDVSGYGGWRAFTEAK